VVLEVVEEVADSGTTHAGQHREAVGEARDECDGQHDHEPDADEKVDDLNEGMELVWCSEWETGEGFECGF